MEFNSFENFLIRWLAIADCEGEKKLAQLTFFESQKWNVVTWCYQPKGSSKKESQFHVIWCRTIDLLSCTHYRENVALNSALERKKNGKSFSIFTRSHSASCTSTQVSSVNWITRINCGNSHRKLLQGERKRKLCQDETKNIAVVVGCCCCV